LRNFTQTQKCISEFSGAAKNAVRKYFESTPTANQTGKKRTLYEAKNGEKQILNSPQTINGKVSTNYL